MLVELAARDDPPTTLDPSLLARLSKAGVQTLAPLLREVEGGVELDETVEELELVRAIFVAGPGLWTHVPLGDEDAPVAVALGRLLEGVERFDTLRRFRLAATDMRLVEQTAADLLDRDGPARVYERMLETDRFVLMDGTIAVNKLQEQMRTMVGNRIDLTRFAPRR